MKYSTPIPNAIFDQYLPYLKEAELKVLMVILRQTLGWYDIKTKNRKVKDWISILFFSKRTNLTTKSVSLAIAGLIDKELIVALDAKENELRYAKDRRGKKRIYYAYAPYFRTIKRQRNVLCFPNICRIGNKTKETLTKERNTGMIRKQHDHERINDLQQRNRNW